ncbi:immunoglobulin superfamily member 3-like [Ranitomeya variabilis]|uniref:immunoglobulin superfamily member 3-like n=1 Tax=Ranitomeya variabilis TaxID=490064 RepID=UPI004055C864
MERSAEPRPLHTVTRWLHWVIIVGVSWAQREVTIQQGPLYRTMGSHVTIWCKVSGYQGPSEQNFQFSIYLPTALEREVQIVSTKDPGFSYAIYSSRVSRGDIYVERLAGDHTVLHIRQLQERDAGEYECHTPNTDPQFYGSYSAKVILRVLPDTLLVTMPHEELERTEGSSLEVTCRVSRASSQHTHLSVSWFLDPEDVILSLSRDFVLVPGKSFSERFRSGDIRLDKLSDSDYKLTIKQLRLSDQGDLFCRGSEWIQDLDGTWTQIMEKSSENTMVKVSALQGGDFQVQVQSPDTTIQIWGLLEITCSISRYSLMGGQFRVSWLLDGAVVATWNPSGVSNINIQYRIREEKGQISVRRQDQDTWTLRISYTTEQETGSYMCDVTEEETQRRRQSSPVSVTIQTPVFLFQNVTLSIEVSELYEGDSVTFFCQVSSPSPSLDVTWLTLRPSGWWEAVASLRHDGEVVVLGEYAQKQKSGYLTAQRLENGRQSLTLDSLVQGDSGSYICRLTEWSQETHDERTNMTYSSNSIQIDIRRLDSSLEVVLMSRDQQVMSGSSARLFCVVKAPYGFRDRRLSWSWDFQPDSGSLQKLVNVSGEGDVSWGAANPGLQGKAQLSIAGTTSTLTIHQVQRQHHQGAYRCRVQVLSQSASVPRASATSITMSIKVQLPAARLMVDSADRTVLVTAGQDEAAVSCNIRALTPGAVLHVGWFLVSPASPSAVNIVNVTHEGLTSRQPGFPWFLSERVSLDKIILRILRPQLLGSFYCAVRELLPESGEWLTLAERTSGVTRVMLRASDTTLSVCKENISRAEPAGGDVLLRCSLEEVPGPAAIFSVSWYYQAAPSSFPSLLYRARWDGVTEYNEALAGRLQVGVVAQGNYSLTLCAVGQEDAGIYHCRLEEWRLQKDGWRLEASDTSGYLQLTVTAPDDWLLVNITTLTLAAPEGSSLALPCHVVSTSVPGSTFSITWWKVGAPGHQLLYNASHLGQWAHPGEDGYQYEQTSEQTFQLRILRAHPPDTGIYYCRVQEWARTPRGLWYQIGQQTGGNMSVTIQTTGVGAHVCSSPALLYVLLLFLGLLLILLAVLGWRFVTRWRNRAGRSPPMSMKGLWTSPVKVNGQTERPDDDDEAEQVSL